MLRLDFRVVGSFEVPRGVFLAVAFLVAVFLEVFFAVFFAVVFLAAVFLVVFLPDDFLVAFCLAVFLVVFPADDLLPEAFFTVGFLRAAAFLPLLRSGRARPPGVFFLPDVFFAGAMAAGR